MRVSVEVIGCTCVVCEYESGEKGQRRRRRTLWGDTKLVGQVERSSSFGESTSDCYSFDGVKFGSGVIGVL